MNPAPRLKKRSAAAKAIMPESPITSRHHVDDEDEDAPVDDGRIVIEIKADLLERIGRDLSSVFPGRSLNLTEIQMWRDVAWRLTNDADQEVRSIDDAVKLVVAICKYLDDDLWEILPTKQPF